MLKVGKQAPDFTATLDDGSSFTLSSYRGHKHVVLYFYPKDFTAGCTAQACSFRDNFAAIAAYDAVIVGVSADQGGSHSSFREKHTLPFPLITDPERKLQELYDAKGWVPWMTPRITYVIDKDGVVRAAIRHDLRVKEHVPDVLAALQALQPATVPN